MRLLVLPVVDDNGHRSYRLPPKWAITTPLPPHSYYEFPMFGGEGKFEVTSAWIKLGDIPRVDTIYGFGRIR